MSEENESLENATNLSLDTSIKYDGDTPTNISDDMEKSYLEYSMAVIVSRALPDVRD
jgi:DNA gyrase subunit A